MPFQRIVAGNDLANAAKPPIAGRDVRFEYRVHIIRQPEIGMADDPCANANRALALLALSREG
jgi:hypothetical protein